jgi:hypothetical protein
MEDTAVLEAIFTGLYGCKMEMVVKGERGRVDVCEVMNCIWQ